PSFTILTLTELENNNYANDYSDKILWYGIYITILKLNVN
ncbi:1329_t:CDS:1, partial [Entrophospora sp. SA101]